MEKFYSHLKVLPEDQYDEMRVDFLKKYTEGALDALIKHRAELRMNSTGRQNQQAQSTTSSIKNFFGGKSKNQSKDPASQIDASKYLDLNKFWQISQDSNTSVPQQTRQRALANLIEILKKYQNERCFSNQMSKIDFMNLALENVANNKSMYTSIKFLQSLIMTYPKESMGGGRNYSQQSYGGRNNQQ